MKIAIGILFTFLLCSAGVVHAAQPWPEIQSARQTFHIELPSAQPDVNFVIRSRAGRAAYKIDCGTYETPIGAFDYSGEFECRLISLYQLMKYSTLFTENPHQDADWESRARFFAKEVVDPCGQIPNFGRVRTFALRGMKVTLELSDIRFAGQGKDLKLKSFDFTISVDEDKNAQSAIAEPPLLDPKWKALLCPLDDSVTPHFRGDASNK